MSTLDRMPRIEFADWMKAQCRQYVAKRDLAGGIVKKGMVVLSSHPFRIYIPVDKGDPPIEVVPLDVDGQLFKAFFEEVKKGEGNSPSP